MGYQIDPTILNIPPVVTPNTSTQAVFVSTSGTCRGQSRAILQFGKAVLSFLTPVPETFVRESTRLRSFFNPMRCRKPALVM